MIPINHNHKLFYQIDISKLKNLDRDSLEIISHINSTWSDIEYLNYLFHKNFGRLSDDTEINMLFPSLIIFSESFYIYLSIICKLIEKLSKKHKVVDRLFSLNKKFIEGRILVIRNCLLVHKEKPFYRKRVASMSGTSPSNFIEHKIVVLNDKGNKQLFTLKPLKDVELMLKLLKNLNDLLVYENK